ncbi:MAG: hypothetical protein ACI865_002563 [Flavobacteriaceae bacterium]|jgi:hypothetical protein
MYLKSTLAILTALILLNANAQQVQTSSISEVEPIHSEVNVILTEVSKNNLSSSITAHTYKLGGAINSSSQDIDSNLSDHSTSIKRMIDTFLTIDGVSRCTFDTATQTFTILSEPAISLSNVIQLINNN